MMERSSRLQDSLTPIEKAELQHTSIFLFVLDHYESLSPRFKFWFDPDKEAGNDSVKEIIRKLNKIGTKVSQTAKLRLLIDAIFDKGTFDKLHDGAKSLGKMRRKLLHHYFVTPSSLQDSPQKVKELSEKKGREEYLAKEERQVAKKLDFLKEDKPGVTNRDTQKQLILPIVIKQEKNVPTEIKEDVRLKPFSSQEVMD